MSPSLCSQYQQLIDREVPAEANSKAPRWFEFSCQRLWRKKEVSRWNQMPCGFLLRLELGAQQGSPYKCKTVRGSLCLLTISKKIFLNVLLSSFML